MHVIHAFRKVHACVRASVSSSWATPRACFTDAHRTVIMKEVQKKISVSLIAWFCFIQCVLSYWPTLDGVALLTLRLHYIASFWMLAHVRPISLSVNILAFNIFDRYNLPLQEFGVKSGTLLANPVSFITFGRETLQLFYASLYWYRISNFNSQWCSSLSWTLVLGTIVLWSYFHVAWSIPVASQESYDHLPYVIISWIIFTLMVQCNPC